VYSAPNVVLVFFSGLLVDRVGMGVGGVLFNLFILSGAAVCALVPQAGPSWPPERVFPMLLVGRLLIGVGGESVVATTLKMISRSFSSTPHLNTAMAVNQAVIQLLGSSAPFYFLPGLGGVPEANRALLLVCLVSLGASVLYWGLERGCGTRCFADAGPDRELAADEEAVALRAPGYDATRVGSGGAAAASAAKHVEPLSALATLRRFPRAFWLLILHIGLTSPCLWTFSDFGTLYLQENFASTATAEAAGKTMSLLYLGIVMAPVTGFIIDRIGHRTLVQLVAASVVPLLFLALDNHVLSPAAALAAMGFVYGVTETNGFALVALVVPEEVQGAAFGLVGCVISIALIVEPYAVGALRERYGTFQSSMALFICVTVLGAAVAALVHARAHIE
jgi:MFS family permease